MKWYKRALAFTMIMSAILQVSIHLPVLTQEFVDLNPIGNVDASFAGGDGTQSNPYLISEIIQLQDIGMNLGANYSIINDIDASETLNWNDGKGFEPIGDKNNTFNGSLDGGGYEIRSLHIDRKEQEFVGLIGYSGKADLSNITLIDVEIFGKEQVGGLVGRANNTEIFNCSSSGEVESISPGVGGLVGVNNGTVTRCYSTCTVISETWATGGLAAANFGLIQDCYSSSNVYGDRNVGGLVGENHGPIYNCSSAKEVHGSMVVGGLIGLNNGGSIYNSNSSAHVYGRTNYIGGLVGSTYLAGEILDCFATGDVEGNAHVGGLIGYQYSGNISDCFASGDVEGEYYIGGLMGLQNAGNISDCYASGDVEGENYIGGFIGVSHDQNFNSFARGNVTGNKWAAGFVGWIGITGNVSNCYAIGDVYCQQGGGFVGENRGLCSNCFSHGNVICEYKVEEILFLGGFVLENFGGKCEKCYSTGSIIYNGVIEDKVNIGGFSASWWGSIQDCFWDYESSGINTSFGGMPKSTADMMNEETFKEANWDFEDTWTIHDGLSYPFLQDQYHSPIILSVVPNATEDQLYSYQITSSLSYIPGYENIPEYYMMTNADWLSITADGLLSGMPDNEDVGTCWARITVIDLEGNTDRKNFTFEVVNTNDDPVILTETLPDAIEDVKYWMKVDGIDTDPTEDILLWEIVQTNATFLTIDNSTGVISGTPVERDIGTYVVEISLTDGNGGSNSTIYELSVLDVNDLPVIISEDVKTIMQDEPYNISYRAYDEDDPNDFKWYLHTNAFWLSMLNGSGKLTGIPGNNDTGQFFVNITVEDLRGGRTSRNFTLEVVDVNDPPIWITIPEDQEIFQESLFSFELEAIDIDDPDFFVWDLNTNARWLSLISGTGELSGIPRNGDIGYFFANVTVEDVRGGRTSHNFTIHVKDQNDLPTWSNIPGDSTVNESDEFSFDVDAFDIDGDTLVYGITSKPMTDISINPVTGIITWNATLEYFIPPYNVLSVKLNVTDGYKVLYHNFTISVMKNSTTEPGSSDTETESDNSSNNSVLIILMILLFVIIIIGIIFTILMRKKSSEIKQKGLPTSTTGSAYQGINNRIFISYAKNNSETALKICDILESSGFKCWIAPRDILPGETWGKAIIDGINSCRLMIMVFSEDSNQSVQVLREIERAVHKNIPIIIFRISEIEPSKEFEYYVSAVHWLDAVSEPVDQHMENLRDVVIRSFKVRSDDKKVLDQKIQKELKPSETSEVEALPPIRDEVE